MNTSKYLYYKLKMNVEVVVRSAVSKRQCSFIKHSMCPKLPHSYQFSCHGNRVIDGLVNATPFNRSFISLPVPIVTNSVAMATVLLMFYLTLSLSLSLSLPPPRPLSLPPRGRGG
eukprot:sb/3476771/